MSEATHIPELGSAASLPKWRQCRNAIIARIRQEANLSPSQIVRLYYMDLYPNGRAAIDITVPGRIARGGEPYEALLSPTTCELLKQLNPQPLLFYDFPLTQPLITDRPNGKPLTAEHVRRLCKRKLTDRSQGV